MSKHLFLGYESINTVEKANKAATQMAKGNYPPGLDHCFVAGINGVFDDPDGICNFYIRDPETCVCPEDVKQEFVEILEKRAKQTNGYTEGR